MDTIYHRLFTKKAGSLLGVLDIYRVCGLKIWHFPAISPKIAKPAFYK